MELRFDYQVKELRNKATKLIHTFPKSGQNAGHFIITMPEDFLIDFYALVDKVVLSLMEGSDHFYGYFLIQMSREIRFDITSPTAVNFKGARYVIYFNPLMFLNLSLKQMETTIKHEILHIISLHLVRARDLKGRYSPLVLNMAMDLAVNIYLDHLPPYFTTLEQVNLQYSLKLQPYATFEYYADKLQTVFGKEQKEITKDKKENRNMIEADYVLERTHDLWEETDEIDAKTLQEFTEKVVREAQKGELPTYLSNIITSLKNSREELPWNIYLNRLMGSVESSKKKVITRRDRRQPDRLDLRGQLRSHKANIAVAIDISGSMSDEEFKQAMQEVLAIVKNYNHEITLIECDDAIRRTYKVKSPRDLKERIRHRGSTRFSPVFEFANHNKINLLIYFTDGKGEDQLQVIPKGYHILWVISGDGDNLSLKEPYGAVKKLKALHVKEEILDISDVPTGGFSMNYHEKMI